ncbi:MAG: SAM-dependent methyltransferase [Phycisphaerales bacterium]|nr:SAM-dependent methyltransferase [Phycisphaerales bacterium]
MTPAVSIEISAADPLCALLPPTCAGAATHVLSRDGEGRLELRRSGDALGRGIRVDLATILIPSLGALRRQPLIRALGDATDVVDCTAGLLGDAWLIAATGRRVFATERDPCVHALALDGLARVRASSDAKMCEIASRIELLGSDAPDACAIFASRGVSPEVTAVFLDPMFPPKRKKSALPPKEMQILKELLGEVTEDARLASEHALLAAARALQPARIVVKRPEHAGDFAQSRPSWSLHGTLVRFDVYATHSKGGAHV